MVADCKNCVISFYNARRTNGLIIRINDSIIILLEFTIYIVSDSNWLFMQSFDEFIHILVYDTCVRLDFNLRFSSILTTLILSLIRVIGFIINSLISKL